MKPDGPTGAARTRKRAIKQYDHADEKRKNNPPVGLVTPRTDRDAGKKRYAYDPHIDPALQFDSGGAETMPNTAGANTVREVGPAYSAPQRVVVSFGPEHAPLEQRQVEMAWEEARTLVPRPSIILFAAFQLDPEAAKDIDELTPEKTGMTFLKVQMNTG